MKRHETFLYDRKYQVTPSIELLFGPSSNYISSCNEDDEFLYCPDAVIAVPAGLPWWIWLILVLFILLLGICVDLLFLSLNNALLDTDLSHAKFWILRLL